jgi:hypothetical protein
MFSVVVASLRGVVVCVSRWWSPFGRPGSQPISGEVASIMSRPSALRVTWLADDVEGAEALRRRTALHWGGWLIEVARRRGLPLADLINL